MERLSMARPAGPAMSTAYSQGRLSKGRLVAGHGVGRGMSSWHPRGATASSTSTNITSPAHWVAKQQIWSGLCCR